MSAAQMRGQPRWYYPAVPAIIAGLAWFALGWQGNWLVAVIASLPGILCVGAATALLLWPGDRHITHFLAFGSVIGAALALPLALGLGVIAALVLIVASAVCFVSAGWAALAQQVWPEAAPLPPLDLATAHKAAADEALLGFFVTSARVPHGADVDRDLREVAALQDLRDAGGDAVEPRPDAPERFDLAPARSLGQAFEWLTFDSGFAPDPALPGAARWRGYHSNDHMFARVLRHPGRARPWLLCIHGYRMGANAMDLSLFAVQRLHEGLGLNLLMPILPLHGPRKAGRLSGGRFLDGPVLDVRHAESQSLWDLRRCLAWIRREQPQAAVGALGYSLGGYNAALLAAYETSLACVIAAIPVTDLPAAVWIQMPWVHRRYMESRGIDADQLSALMAPVSPLHRDSTVPRQRRHILAATADQLVAPRQPLALWRHWGEPSIRWYHGSHLSVRRDPGNRAFVESALASGGLAAPY